MAQYLVSACKNAFSTWHLQFHKQKQVKFEEIEEIQHMACEKALSYTMKNTSLFDIFQYLSVMIARCIKSECWLYTFKLQNVIQL